ncbi:oxygen tolerance domain protein, partial [Bordetella bronchiseptica E013]
MRRWLPLACAALLALGLAGAPRAQDAPPLRVTARLPAGAQAQAGATLRLELDVMTTTWFTQPPRLPALTLPGVMVTPPSGEGELVRAEHNGVAYSGLRYTYLLSPTAAGQVQVPALAVSAEVGPGKTPASASSAPLWFTVGGAAGGQPALHGALTVSQDFALAPDPLVAGGRVTRSITQRAEGVQAMLLPPAPLADVPGFKRYAREPEVTTLTDGRGGFVGGQRIDRADYVAEQAGELSLPAVTLAWRDGAGGQPRQQALPGRTFAVAAAPAVAPPFSLTDDLARLRHGLRWVLPAAWLAWAAGGALALLALWLGWPWWRQGLCRLRAAALRRRARRRAGEPWQDRESTRLNSSHSGQYRMPSSA